MKRYIAALDQGTTSSRCILFDQDQNILGTAQRELTQIYPQPGWVEQDPMEIWSTQYSVLTEVLAQTGISPHELAAIGITNQRETTIVWDKVTGRPIYNAIVWQCRRTAPLCEQLKEDRTFTDYVQEHTGLLIDAYFSATKLSWILDHVEGAGPGRRPESFCSAPWTPGWCGSSPAERSISPTAPTPAARCSSTSRRCAGTPISAAAWASPYPCFLKFGTPAGSTAL